MVQKLTLESIIRNVGKNEKKTGERLLRITCTEEIHEARNSIFHPLDI